MTIEDIYKDAGKLNISIVEKEYLYTLIRMANLIGEKTGYIEAYDSFIKILEPKKNESIS